MATIHCGKLPKQSLIYKLRLLSQLNIPVDDYTTKT